MGLNFFAERPANLLFPPQTFYQYEAQKANIAICPGLGIARRWDVFFDVWPALPRVGRITLDVVRGMSVTDFTTVGHIAKPTRSPKSWLTI